MWNNETPDNYSRFKIEEDNNMRNLVTLYSFEGETYEDLQDLQNAIDDYLMDHLECEGGFDDYLDDNNESIEIFGLTYAPSQVYQSADKVAYRQAMLEHCDNLMGDIMDEVEALEPGDSYDDDIISVECFEDEV